jgi:hypothetical protein
LQRFPAIREVSETKKENFCGNMKEAKNCHPKQAEKDMNLRFNLAQKTCHTLSETVE